MLFTKKKHLLEKRPGFYHQIVDKKNIEQAYLEVAEKLISQGKTQRYKGADGVCFQDIEQQPAEMIDEIYSELLALKALRPARYIEIPKKNGGKREIYILNLKERVKCQAIYRVLEPFFEKKYTPYLFSFRRSHPTYEAMKGVRRFYLRHSAEVLRNPWYVLKLDITQYSETINHHVLFSVLREEGIDESTLELIQLFLQLPYYREGRLMSLHRGLMTGMPLCTLFTNVLFHRIDKAIGPKVKLYRRVCDDMLLIDRDRTKLEEIHRFVENEAKKLKLSLHPQKSFLIDIEKSFEFLGLVFSDGKVSLPVKTVQKITDGWKKSLKYREGYSLRTKFHFLKSYLRQGSAQTDAVFLTPVRAYNLVTNVNQMKFLSQQFFRILCVYFTGRLNYKNQRKTQKVISDFSDQFHFKSYFRVFMSYTQKIDLKNSRTER